MEDRHIVKLYWDRDENAIAQTDLKYGSYCRKIAFSILSDREDTEECVNDTWLQTWNSIPPKWPEVLRTYLGKICRNIAINLYEKLHAVKRGEGQTAACLEELSEVVGTGSQAEEQAQLSQLTESISRFLSGLDTRTRNMFVQRYWYMLPVREIAEDFGISESSTKMTLSRTREKLKKHLLKEGYDV